MNILGKIVNLFWIVAVFAMASNAQANDVLLADGSRFQNPQILEKMRRGFNLPSWDAAEAERRPTDQALKLFIDSEIQHIRLPVDPVQIIDRASGSSYLADIKATVEQLTKRGFIVSVDMHPGSLLANLYDDDSDSAYLLLEAVWLTLLPSLASFSDQEVLLELLNEPPTDQSIWWNHAKKLVKTLRRHRPTTTLVVAPGGASRFETLLAGNTD